MTYYTSLKKICENMNKCIKCGRPVWKGTKYKRNYWQLYCAKHELEAPKFLGSCDRVRKTESGERFWQDMMLNKRQISEEEFLNNVDVRDVLDEGETWIDYRNNARAEGEPLRFFQYRDNVYFFQHAGFEFIWRREDV